MESESCDCICCYQRHLEAMRQRAGIDPKPRPNLYEALEPGDWDEVVEALRDHDETLQWVLTAALAAQREQKTNEN